MILNVHPVACQEPPLAATDAAMDDDQALADHPLRDCMRTTFLPVHARPFAIFSIAWGIPMPNV